MAFCFALLVCNGASPVSDIRRVDFASLDYPFPNPKSWPHAIAWQSSSEPNRIRLEKGRWKQPGSKLDTSQPTFSGLTFEEVIYGDLSRDGNEDAIVILRYDTGGTQYHYWLYVFQMDKGGPRLLAYLRGGDRSAQGLYRAYIRQHRLVVEVFDPDPEKRQGDCCSTGYLRYTYRWTGETFRRIGAITRGTPASASRRAVSVFGMPWDQMQPQR